MRLAVPVLLALLLAPHALAQAEERIDVRIAVPRQGEPTVTGGGARLLNHTPGEEARFALNLTRDHTTLEVRVANWSVERVRQVLPLLLIDAGEPMCAERTSPCDYPLFEPFPHERVWDVDGPGTPPTFALRPPQNVTDIGFYQETTTGELALADLQVRAVGKAEWVQNPTPTYHVLQRFPVQGLDADTE
ncbi:MAG TPA: hypothetical protein VNX21_07800, partial [Candidatus Thermoplasmatota archaeon]|nr:hypothetical protein [Candidatus Thermoplasmatota archaeon]